MKWGEKSSGTKNSLRMKFCQIQNDFRTPANALKKHSPAERFPYTRVLPPDVTSSPSTHCVSMRM